MTHIEKISQVSALVPTIPKHSAGRITSAIAMHVRRHRIFLMSLQKKNGRWGLGSPWGKTAVDFKQRTRHDAESWEVAEVGLNLLRHHQKFGDPAAKRAARNAASYLRQRVVSLGTGRYLVWRI